MKVTAVRLHAAEPTSAAVLRCSVLAMDMKHIRRPWSRCCCSQPQQQLLPVSVEGVWVPMLR